LLFLSLLFVASTFSSKALCKPPSAPAQNTPNIPLSIKAQAEFAKGNWDAAIPLYKKHLRTFPRDFSAWNQLSAAYYHSGQISLALSTLRKNANSSPDRSFNFFYQGMCLAVLGAEGEANKYWQYASNWNDEFGARATFEMAMTSYNSDDKLRAKQILTAYLQKFPRGPDAPSAKTLLVALESDKKDTTIHGFDRPDREIGIYKYHPWSLFDVPHFWKVQLGYEGSESSGYQPSILGALENNSNTSGGIQVNASLGIGPNRKGDYTSFAGYTYQQNWISDITAFPDWITQGFSMEKFPLRGDYLERTHQLFGDFRRAVGSQLFFGSYVRLEFSRVGSSFFPSADTSSLKIVTSEKDTQLLIPWAGWAWSQTARSMLSLYMRKEIHNESPEHSNKTFDLTGSSGQLALSLNISHSQDFPAKKVEATVDAFQYEFIYNDFWLDYTRRGAIAAVDFNIYNKIGGEALVGIYKDNYKVSQIKTGGCTAKTTIADISESTAQRVACSRSDTGSMLQLGIYYDRSAFLRFNMGALFVENGSSMKVYSDSKKVYRATVTWAFPGTKRVSRMTERFADAAFTKETLE
jgi:tetratricopeptide (TPR) repeat protein